MNPASALTTKGVNLLSPIVFASVLFGAMVPYWSVQSFNSSLRPRFFPNADWI